MSNLRKWLIVLLSVMVTVLCGVAITACSADWRVPKDGLYVDPNEPTDYGDWFHKKGEEDLWDPETSNSYIVNTLSLGGMPISNVNVTILTMDGEEIATAIAKNGKAQFGNVPSGNYKLEYSNLPNGFKKCKDTLYDLTPDNMNVTSYFDSEVIDDTVPGGYYYKLGDVMYDFRYTDADGNRVVLSDLLASGKKLIVLNFWFVNCGPCASEFPAIESAYKMYSADVAVVAVSIKDRQEDSLTRIKNYKRAGNYTFFMGSDVEQSLKTNFQASVAPTTCFIDRYGIYTYRHEGSVPDEVTWQTWFRDYTSDDYQQKLEYGQGGEQGEDEAKDPVDPPADWEAQPGDQIMNQHFLDESIQNFYSLSYYGPESEDDIAHNWPFHVGTDDEGAYIYPSNIGPVTDSAGNKIETDPSWSILNTAVTLEENETLSLEIKYLTQTDNDYVYIILNNSTENAQWFSGKSNGWKVVTLLTASRTTNVTISLMYNKSASTTVDNEFVGFRNLKIEALNEEVDEAIDIRTEVSRIGASGMEYTNHYYSEKDGFYHIGNPDAPRDDDPIMFFNVISATLFSDYHLADYVLLGDGIQMTLGLYNIVYWSPSFNPDINAKDDEEGEEDGNDEPTSDNLLLNFGTEKDAEYTETVVDSFYIQDGTTNFVPVTKDVADMLRAFVSAIFNKPEFSTKVTGTLTDDTWLELCLYYRTVGTASHTDNPDHVCLATYNTAAGKSLTYAIEIDLAGEESTVITVDTSNATRRNGAGGLFYKFTAPEDGVYSFTSLLEYFEGDPVDPKIFIWEEDADVFRGNPLIEMDDMQSVERFDNYSSNFKAILYLKKGETIYPQISTRMTDYPGIYDVEIRNYGSEYWEFETATTGDGVWTIDDWNGGNKIYYISVETGYDASEDIYYHIVDNKSASPMYIDFIRRNFHDVNGITLKEMIDSDYFNFAKIGGANLTPMMNMYYAEAINKPKSDPTYGMIEASGDLVAYIIEFLTTTDEDTTLRDHEESGSWKKFAYFFNYYGPTAWKDMETAD